MSGFQNNLFTEKVTKLFIHYLHTDSVSTSSTTDCDTDGPYFITANQTLQFQMTHQTNK